MQPERVDAFRLHPFVPEDTAVDEGLRRHLADDPGLFVIGRAQSIDIEGRFREPLVEPGVEEPTQRGGVRFIERFGVRLVAVGRIVRCPRHVQPGVGALGEDRGPLLAREGVVHRGDDVIRPLGTNDPRGERFERAHPFASRNPAMNPTSVSTPSSVIAL